MSQQTVFQQHNSAHYTFTHHLPNTTAVFYKGHLTAVIDQRLFKCVSNSFIRATYSMSLCGPSSCCNDEHRRSDVPPTNRNSFRSYEAL